MRLTLARQEALPDPDNPGGRLCAYCGDVIDPVYYCPDCAAEDLQCAIHARPRKRADAAFCGAPCRAKHRSSFITDCT